MGTSAKSLVWKLAVLLGFAAMVILNWMATIGTINGITTAGVSKEYNSLFAPADYAFSIWGLIYLLLLVYVLFQLFTTRLDTKGSETQIAFWFVISCIVNIGWIFMWHHRQISFVRRRDVCAAARPAAHPGAGFPNDADVLTA